jgi:monooxygenase
VDWLTSQGVTLSGMRSGLNATNGSSEGANGALEIEHVDVLIVGAGISGICAAVHLQRECPGKSFALLEGRDSIGGTWDLFRYPGIRSDSDMQTLGFRFKPWTSRQALADGPAIMDYLHEAIDENGLESRIRLGHRVVGAEWSSETARWTVTVERPGEADQLKLSCEFLFSCSGYYRYEKGYTPELEGIERFGGPVVHPQHWPEDLDYDDKRVVVIGSGATAVTLVPALAERAAKVTMLQRTPTYVMSLPAEDPISTALSRVLPDRATYFLVRWKNVILTSAFYRASRRWPKLMRRLIRRATVRALPEGYDVDTHFNPPYNPWDQRVCLIPDGDLFRAIGAGKADVVTDTIAGFTESGIRLGSGVEQEADIVVTATGLDLIPFGGVELAVDGEPVSLPDTIAYKAMMLSGVPNFAFALGYTNASWTLKAELTAEYVCRLLNHIDSHGWKAAVPVRAPGVEEAPFLDFTPGYVLRALHRFPKQGTVAPWRVKQSYPHDLRSLRYGSVEEGMRFFNPAPEAPRAVGVASEDPAAALEEEPRAELT